MKYRGLLLDIDNTLYSYDEAHRIAIEKVFEQMSESIPCDARSLAELYERAKQHIHQDLAQTASSHNKLLYFQRMCEMSGISALVLAPFFYHIYLDTFYNAMHAYEHVYSFLAYVKSRKICLVTDLTADLQLEKIKRLRLFDYAGYLVTSEEIGREKPDPEIFMRALKKIDLGPDEVCMIGNSLQCDILGAVSVGIKSFWFNPQQKGCMVEPSVTMFTDFKELMEYFDE